MGHPDDLEATVRGIKASREIFAQPALAKYVRRIVLPDCDLLGSCRLAVNWGLPLFLWWPVDGCTTHAMDGQTEAQNTRFRSPGRI